MITDKLTTFGLELALNTGGAGDYAIGDVIDTRGLGVGQFGGQPDIGGGRPCYLVIQVDTAATSGGSATAELKLITHAAAAPTPGSEDVIVQTGAVAVADMGLGISLLVVALPREGIAYKRYISIEQTTAAAAFTAGAIDAFLTFDAPNWKAYPEGRN